MANDLFTQAIERATVSGEAIDDVNAQIIPSAALSQRQTGALFLFADVLRRRGERRRMAQESLGRVE